MPTNIDLRRLLESVARDITPDVRLGRFGASPFSDTIGFHVYGELNLTLKLTAAKDARDAQRLLRILQEYTLIAEACATESSAVLLEVQGERIHLLIPAATVDANSVSEVLRFCIAFTNAVYSRISKTAGQEFQGFGMAVDHGRAILVASGIQSNGSIVSLGPAANAPAKELKKKGKAAHLRMRSKHYACLQSPPSSGDWVDVPVLKPTNAVAGLVSGELSERFLATSNQYIEEALRNPSEVAFADAAFLGSFAGGYVHQAIKVQGFPLRADMDGFSKQVEEAFAAGEAAIVALVQRFINVMQYPAQFRTRIGKTIDLPWAGDCASLVVLPNDSGYEDAREHLPVKAAGEWHSQRVGKDLSNRSWSDHFGKAKWAVGICGGDDKEGSDGYVLIAPVAGRTRDFLVGAGWGIGRSLDAQESDGVSGDDTVIHDIDYDALDSSNKVNFKQLNSLFWISHGLTSGTVRSSGIGSLAYNTPLYVPSVTKPVPTPRPWCEIS